MIIDISRFDKAEVLAALHGASRQIGMGKLHPDRSVTIAEARALLAECKYFDYLRGRVMKVDLAGDHLDPRLYDRDNGEGAAAAALAQLSPTVAA